MFIHLLWVVAVVVWFCFVLHVWFETESHYGALADLELIKDCLCLPESWDQRRVPPCPAAVDFTGGRWLGFGYELTPLMNAERL